MSAETLLLLIMIIIVIGILPSWPHSKSWGYTPTGVLTIILVIFLIWAVTQDRPLFRSSTGRDIESAVQEVGHDIKEAGRDVADSIRGTAQ
jgi:hypothetical protein